MSADQFPKATQSADRLQSSASASGDIGTPVSCTAPAGEGKTTLAQTAKHMMASNDKTSSYPSCEQRLSFTFFFDGTGNNRDADTPTFDHSNVAMMFDAH